MNPEPLDERCSSALCSPASQELEAVLQTNGTSGDCHELQSPFGDSQSCLLERTQVSTCDEDETVYDVYPQLRDLPEENLDSLLRALQPQDDCPPILQSPKYTTLGNVTHPLQPQDYQPLVILQSPIYTKQGNDADANLYYGECTNWQSESKKTVSTDRVDIPVRHVMSNIENQAPDYWSLKVPHPQTEVNRESPVYPFQPQDPTLQPLMCTKNGDALHDIECNKMQSSFGDNHSSSRKFLNTSSAYQDYYSSDQTAQTPYHGDSGVSNDSNTEVAHGWVQYLSALAMGTTLQCS